VESHGGIVNQFVGDEVLALFGIPVAHEDDPIRAVWAAIGLREMVRAASPDLEGRIGRPLRLHTGINTGLIVTHLGDARDGSFAITGTTVNIGSRLKDLAGDDEIVVGSETRALVADYFETEPMPAVTPKGMAREIVPARIIAPLSARTRFEVAERRGLTRYTGRESELALLGQKLTLAIQTQGQLVAVSGDPGLGKSRLLHEFRARLDRSQCTVLEGRCQPYGSSTPYLPLLGALRQAFGVREDASIPENRERAIASVRAHDPRLERFLPHYLHLLAIPSEEYRLPEVTEEVELRAALENALCEFVAAASRNRPAVLVLEDWHWSDGNSRSALRRLIGRCPSLRLLLVLSYRLGEFDPDWSDAENLTEIRLNALNPKDTERMIGSVLGVELVPMEIAARIHERTAGNPLFNEELCQALRDDGTVIVQDRRLVLTRPLSGPQLPQTIESVIQSRLDRLDKNALRTLRLASVIGPFFTWRLLSQLAGANALWRESLDRLIRRELIQEDERSGEPEFRFKHALTHWVVYESLLHLERQDLHVRVGKAIEELYADRIEEQAETLAYHFERGGNAELAVQYRELAARKATRSCAFTLACEHYRSAFAQLTGWPDTPGRLDRGLSIALRWANASQGEPSGELLKALESLLESIGQTGSPKALARILRHTGWCHLILGDFPQALRLLKSSWKLSRKLNDSNLTTQALNWLGRAYWAIERFLPAVEYLRNGLRALDASANSAEMSLSQAYLGMSLAHLGRFTAAQEQGQQALELARHIGNKGCESFARISLATTHAALGNWAHAKRLIHENLELSLAVGSTLPMNVAQFCLGEGEFHAGDREQGLRLMQQAIASGRAKGTRFMNRFQGYLAFCLARHGQLAEARESLEQHALAELGRSRSEVHALCARALLADAEAPAEPEAALKLVRDAIQLADELGLMPDRAQCRFRHAELLLQSGRTEPAATELKRAMDGFRSMEMQGWLELAERLRERTEPQPRSRGRAAAKNGTAP
jgi:tetratricopeptide (TPR) repeat protein